MDLIDDIDLVLSLGWFKPSTFYEFTDIFDTIVGCSINLYHIKHISIIECTTIHTFVTGISVLEIGTIHSLCEDTSAGCFSCSTRTGENICMSDSSLYERVAEYRGD